jgi:hypothetical protein
MGNLDQRRPSLSGPPHGLWSLWDLMLKKAALEFGRSLADLAQLETVCRWSRELAPGTLRDDTGTMAPLANDIIGNLKRVCILADLDDVLPELDRFGQAISGAAPLIEDVQGRAGHLRTRLLDELENEHYFQVDRQDVRHYGQKAPFGEPVAKKFKSALPDIESAGNCLALQEPTACVFHLMRAMEVAVRQLGRRLKVTITPQTTWRQMTGSMDPKIKAMPEATERQKAKKNEWESARANLHHVGSVWRNNTMHPAASYTRSQALDIINAVRVFMSGLAAL